jgi:hypothetical protein
LLPVSEVTEINYVAEDTEFIFSLLPISTEWGWRCKERESSTFLNINRITSIWNKEERETQIYSEVSR